MRKQKGFSLIELLIVVAIILIIAAIAIPSLLRSRIAANDSAAVSTIRTLNTSELTFLSAYPKHGYAELLADLGPGATPVNCGSPASVTDTSACLIDAVVGCGTPPCVKSGFDYNQIKVSSATQPVPDYVVSAYPQSFGTSGDQNLCSFMDGVVRTSKNGSTPTNSSITTAPDLAGCNSAVTYGPVQ
jgi:prepilin-type N-terminal cleavage/methylation domain-containing protein